MAQQRRGINKMKEYQEPKIDIVVFEVKDIVTVEFDSYNIGEWE